MSQLRVKLWSPKARAPSPGWNSDAGYDLYSASEVKIPKRGKALITTDISIEFPENTYGQILPRSGLANKYSITTGAGVIDRGYTGKIKVLLFNHSERDYFVKEGDRVAQLICVHYSKPEVTIVEELPQTDRGDLGFGSSGL
jgi:dUTP pyrophosphatase